MDLDPLCIFCRRYYQVAHFSPPPNDVRTANSGPIRIRTSVSFGKRMLFSRMLFSRTLGAETGPTRRGRWRRAATYLSLLDLILTTDTSRAILWLTLSREQTTVCSPVS